LPVCEAFFTVVEEELPLKQGLKQNKRPQGSWTSRLVEEELPLKQGLKQKWEPS